MGIRSIKKTYANKKKENNRLELENMRLDKKIDSIRKKGGLDCRKTIKNLECYLELRNTNCQIIDQNNRFFEIIERAIDRLEKQSEETSFRFFKESLLDNKRQTDIAYECGKDERTIGRHVAPLNKKLLELISFEVKIYLRVEIDYKRHLETIKNKSKVV